jgi:hypothetical protein
MKLMCSGLAASFNIEKKGAELSIVEIVLAIFIKSKQGPSDNQAPIQPSLKKVT